MSTNYIFEPVKTKNQILKIIKKLGFEIVEKDKKGDSFCITNGECYIWAYVYGEKRKYVDFVRYGGNYAAQEDILIPIAEALNVNVYDEHSDGYAELMGMNDSSNDEE